MEPFTIFLDINDHRRERFFWSFHIFMSIVWITQGIRRPEPDGYSWSLIIGGGLALLASLANFIVQKKFGRRRLIFNEDGLEIKVKQLGHTQKIPWQEIEHIKLQMNEAEIVNKTPHNPALKIPFESYVVNQQAKKLFRDYATQNNIPVL